jgi:hypothetical protein
LWRRHSHLDLTRDRGTRVPVTTRRRSGRLAIESQRAIQRAAPYSNKHRSSKMKIKTKVRAGRDCGGGTVIWI